MSVSVRICSICAFAAVICGCEYVRLWATYCRQPLDNVGGVLGLCNLGRAEDAFEAGRGAPFDCECKTIPLTDYSLALLETPREG